MFHYSNLSDTEFEALCKDIMSKKLAVKLERFGSGRDNGIDLTEDAFRQQIIVQVKHYIKTDVKGLITALKKEIPKVEKLSPQQYYICCSKELTPANKRDIYSMFSDYMDSTQNIIGITEIDDFLKNPENIQILQKHFKIWIESTNILTSIYSQDIFIDSEAMLSSIEQNVKLFVTTESYYNALDILDHKRILIIVGQPGSGKSITSEMLVLTYASRGYRVRYTSDATDLSSVKRSISESPDTKEVILLDDCFGQAYFNMKENQGNSLQTLIKYVRMHPSKILIMNSRVTIYHEARELNTGLWKSYDQKDYDSLLIDLDNMSYKEKAKIFYNHLYFYDVPQDYRDNILLNKNYRFIVKHRNFNPRVVEFVCTKRHWIDIAPNTYAQYILQCLNEPNEIWKIEYEQRLAREDRAFLMTLYSLTNTHISTDFFKKCFDNRLLNIPDIDGSINHYERILLRLSESMIRLLDVHGEKHISVANPSVNDFLRSYLKENSIEKSDLRKSACSIQQIKRLYDQEQQSAQIDLVFQNRAILNFVFESQNQKRDYITYWCSEHGICDASFRSYVQAFVKNPHDIYVYSFRNWNMSEVLNKLFDEPLCTFYELPKLVCNIDILRSTLSNMNLIELTEFIPCIDRLFIGESRNKYLQLICSLLLDAQDEYCDAVSVDDYDIDMNDIMAEYTQDPSNRYSDDLDSLLELLEAHVKGLVEDEMAEFYDNLPDDLPISEKKWCSPSISVDDCDLYINNYFGGDRDDGYDLRHDYKEGSDSHYDYDAEIDSIFE